MGLDTIATSMAPLAPVGALAARVFFGWLKNSLADGKIQAADWKKLGKCSAVVASIATFVYLGTDFGAVQSVAIASLADVARNDVVEPAFKG